MKYLPFTGLGLIIACATSSPEGEPIDGGAAEGGGESSSPSVDADAECSGDCLTFPPSCVAGAFCPVDLGLEPSSQIGGLGGTARELWAVGNRGRALRNDGTEWKPSDTGTVNNLAKLAVGADGEVWALGFLSQIAVHGANSTGDAGVSADGWSLLPVRGSWVTYGLRPIQARGIWNGAGGQTMWIATNWVSVRDQGLHGLSRARRDGDTITLESPILCAVGSCVDFLGVHGVTAGELWAVGINGTVIHVTNAEAQTPTASFSDSRTTQTLHGVWVAGPNDVWAVGALGTMIHYRGPDAGWQSVEVPTTKLLRAIVGLSPTDIWAVGDSATILHFDGAEWTRIPVAALRTRRPALYAVVPLEDGRVYASGDGVVLSYPFEKKPSETAQ